MKKLIAPAIAVAGMLLGAGPAAAATIPVDDDSKASRSNCDADAAASPTIQGAIDASSRRDTIKVCPGTYTEAPRIDDTKDKITLVSVERFEAIIKSPAIGFLPPKGDIVHVQGADDVKLLDFKISGPLPDTEFCNTFPLSGVRVDGGGSARIAGNHITEIRSTSPALRGCQNGVGIVVGHQAEGETGSARIRRNLIEKYQKNGMLIDGEGSEAEVEENDVLGDGPVDPASLSFAAQNGIQVSRGANAYLEDNDVFDNAFFDVNEASSAGIVLFQAGSSTRVVDNETERNDDNIALFDTDGARIEDNDAHDSPSFDGIYVDADSTDNRLEDNSASGNANLDCEDGSEGSRTAGTANRWIDNEGETADPPEICEADDDD